MTTPTMQSPECFSLVEIVASVEGVGLTTAFRILSHTQRHYLIWELPQHSPPITVDTISRGIALQVADQLWEETSSQAIQNIETQIHHCHLPKLDAAGLIEYDSNRRVIEDIAPELQNIRSEGDLKQ